MAVNLTHYIDDLARAIKDPRVLRVGAEAMADEMRKATARYIGADLRMSGFRGGPVEIQPTATATQIKLTIGGGTYALADSGRKQLRRARARRRSALDTPWGPKASARGSRWGGFHITERHADDGFDEAIRAVTNELDRIDI